MPPFGTIESRRNISEGYQSAPPHTAICSPPYSSGLPRASPDEKTRPEKAGVVFVLARLLDAENRSPSFEWPVAARLPADKLWSNLDTRIKIKSERSLVLEHDLNNVVIR